MLRHRHPSLYPCLNSSGQLPPSGLPPVFSPSWIAPLGHLRWKFRTHPRAFSLLLWLQAWPYHIWLQSLSLSPLLLSYTGICRLSNGFPHTASSSYLCPPCPTNQSILFSAVIKQKQYKTNTCHIASQSFISCFWTFQMVRRFSLYC